MIGGRRLFHLFSPVIVFSEKGWKSHIRTESTRAAKAKISATLVAGVGTRSRVHVIGPGAVLLARTPLELSSLSRSSSQRSSAEQQQQLSQEKVAVVPKNLPTRAFGATRVECLPCAPRRRASLARARGPWYAGGWGIQKWRARREPQGGRERKRERKRERAAELASFEPRVYFHGDFSLLLARSLASAHASSPFYFFPPIRTKEGDRERQSRFFLFPPRREIFSSVGNNCAACRCVALPARIDVSVFRRMLDRDIHKSFRLRLGLCWVCVACFLRSFGNVIIYANSRKIAVKLYGLLALLYLELIGWTYTLSN